MSRAERLVCTSSPWRWFAERVVLPWVLDDVEPTGDVLEIGGGAGVVADAVLRRQRPVRYTLTDLDPAMVAAAGRRLAAHGDRVTVLEGDATDLPFADASFDLVLCFVMLHHVIDWPGALEEAARVLRPGCRLVGVDLTRTRLTGGFHRTHTGHIDMATPAELGASLRTSGFAEVDLRQGLGGAVVRFDATT